MEKKSTKPAARRNASEQVGTAAWWEQRLASVRGGTDLAIRVQVKRRSDDDTTEDDSTCCDLDSSGNFTWGR